MWYHQNGIGLLFQRRCKGLEPPVQGSVVALMYIIARSLNVEKFTSPHPRSDRNSREERHYDQARAPQNPWKLPQTTEGTDVGGISRRRCPLPPGISRATQSCRLHKAGTVHLQRHRWKIHKALHVMTRGAHWGVLWYYIKLGDNSWDLELHSTPIRNQPYQYDVSIQSSCGLSTSK